MFSPNQEAGQNSEVQMNNRELYLYACAKNSSKELTTLPQINTDGNLPFRFQADGKKKSLEIYGNADGIGDLVTDETNPHYEEYRISVKVIGKNFLVNNASTQTINGVTFTVNKDNSITCNGTANSLTVFSVGSYLLQKDVVYELSGCPTGGGVNTYRLDIRDLSGITLNGHADNGNGYTFSENNDTPCICKIRIASGVTCNNLTFYPMLRFSDILDKTYEPYQSCTTTVYCDAQLSESDYITADIQTVNGTNILSFETETQPSKICIKAKTVINLDNSNNRTVNNAFSQNISLNRDTLSVDDFEEITAENYEKIVEVKNDE